MKKNIFLKMILALGLFAVTGCNANTDQAEPAETVEQEETTKETTEKAGEETSNEDATVEEGSTEDDTETETEGDVSTIELLVPGYDSGYLQAELDESIKKYESENPNTKITIQSVGWDELNSKVVQLYQAGEAPDIMLLGSRSIRQFAELGVLEDLGPYMSDEYLATRIENLMETAAVDGKQYGVPMAFSSRALFYRTDLIDTPPTNWDELLATAKKINEEEDINGFAIPTDATTGTDELLNFFYQGGGSMVDDEGNLTLNTPENIATLEYLQQFNGLIPDIVSTARGDQAQMFVNGDLAMFISGAWEIETLEEGEYDFATAKLPAGKEESVNLVTDSYVVSSISENKDLAWDFIEFMGQPDQQFMVTDAYQWYPVTKAEEDRERYQEEIIKPFIDIIPSGKPEAKVPNWDEFDKALRIAVQKAISGEASAADALEEAQAELTK